MTRDQIESVFTESGNSFDQWISLENDFRYILMESDKNSFVSPYSIQYFFSSTKDYFLTRHLTGNGTLTTLGAAIPAGYSKVFHEGEYYLFKIREGGVTDASTDAAGVYHTLTAFKSISGFFKK
jgi:hypothetical protein